MCQVRAAIVAMFRRAKFYNKIFTPIGEDQVTNTTNTTPTQKYNNAMQPHNYR